MLLRALVIGSFAIVSSSNGMRIPLSKVSVGLVAWIGTGHVITGKLQEFKREQSEIKAWLDEADQKEATNLSSLDWQGHTDNRFLAARKFYSISSKISFLNAVEVLFPLNMLYCRMKNDQQK